MTDSLSRRTSTRPASSETSSGAPPITDNAVADVRHPGPLRGSRINTSIALGVGGSLTMLLASPGAGGKLVHDPVLDGTPFAAMRFGHGYDLAVLATYGGLGLLVWAWIRLGRAVLAGTASTAAVRWAAGAWMVPLLVSVPLFTRDPYSYLAYGAMPLHGIDPYTHGPLVLDGPIPANVHWFWSDTPGMYGPLFIGVAKAVVALCGDNLIAGVILLRVLLVLGLVPLAWALPGLCRHLGGRPEIASWLILANPLTVVVLVGGPHNDLWVIGLLAAGCLLVLNNRCASGILLVSLAAAVKATAALALPFLVLVWATRLSGSRQARIGKATVAGLVIFGEVFAATSLLAGVGLGWITSLSAPTGIVNWLSLPVGTGQLLAHMFGTVTGDSSEEPFILVTRIIGIGVFAVIAVRQWWAARDGGPDAVRRAGIVLMAFAVLAPATLPWYYTWGAVLLAATRWTIRRLQIAVIASVFLIISAFPSGEVALYAFGYLTLMAGAAITAALSLRTYDPLHIRPAQQWANKSE